jgi:2-dehydropantoate 2-reductase
MRVCIYGCGAIGGLLAGWLSRSGAAVIEVARGEHLSAIQSKGLTLLEGDQSFVADVAASDNPAELGEQDLVILAMKGHSVPAIAPEISHLLGAQTAVLTAANGIPWWYFYGVQNEVGTPELVSVDPGKQLWNAIGPERALGSVVYPAASIEAPGVVRHIFGNKFSLGEPAGVRSERLAAIAKLLAAAGFEVSLENDLRTEIWTKLVANAAFNPVSVMTGKTLGAMIDDQAINKLLTQIMDEAVLVAESVGVTPAMSPEQLLTATRVLGDHKTSMLQDFAAGRALELEPIVGAVLELAQLRGVATPNLQMVYQLVKSRSVA